jgi:hypothetical protein
MTVGREALGRKHFKTETIAIAEWGGDVLLRGMTSREQAHIQELATRGVDAQKRTVTNSRSLGSMARFAVIYGWIDADGANVLGVDDEKLLLDEPHSVIERASNIVFRLSGMDVGEPSESDGETTPVDRAEKN